MFNFILLIKTSTTDLLKNKIRTGLTSLGILIGVMSVVLLLAFGQGLKNFVTQQLENLGANVLFVYPGDILNSTSQAGGGMLGTVKFDQKDLKNLQKLNLAKYVVPVFIKRSTIKGGSEKKLSDLYATTPDIFKIRDLKPQTGRLFTDADIGKRAKIAVLGPKIAKDLFGNEVQAVGKTVRAEDQRFTVVGVIEPVGGAGGGGGISGPDYDSYTYIPFTAATAFNPKNEIYSFYVTAATKDDLPDLKAEIVKVMSDRYKKDEYSVIEQKEILSIFGNIFQIINAVLVAIGSISLLVGGVGIMNIMYATVTERTTEIGIRRALGATKGDILGLFLIQATLLSLLGGIIGLALATLIVMLIQPWFPASINLLSVMVALVVSSAIGVFFGVVPATKAAKRSPIDAIRYE